MCNSMITAIGLNVWISIRFVDSSADSDIMCNYEAPHCSSVVLWWKEALGGIAEISCVADEPKRPARIRIRLPLVYSLSLSLCVCSRKRRLITW